MNTKNYYLKQFKLELNVINQSNVVKIWGLCYEKKQKSIFGNEPKTNCGGGFFKMYKNMHFNITIYLYTHRI